MRAATLVVSAAALAATLSIASAQDLRGNIASGRDLAGHWCGTCHRIDGGPPARSGVSTFVQVARLPSTTALSLRVFLRTSHADMPNIQMSEADADDLIVYILSYKEK
jgi:mono/diheme cytochrome c family protein